MLPAQATPLEYFMCAVSDNPGSKPDQKYARWRDKQNLHSGELSTYIFSTSSNKNSSLRTKYWCNVADCKVAVVVVVKFMTVFVARRDSAYS